MVLLSTGWMTKFWSFKNFYQLGVDYNTLLTANILLDSLIFFYESFLHLKLHKFIKLWEIFKLFGVFSEFCTAKQIVRSCPFACITIRHGGKGSYHPLSFRSSVPRRVGDGGSAMRFSVLLGVAHGASPLCFRFDLTTSGFVCANEEAV